MASSLLLERFTHLPESVIAGFTDLQDLLKTKAKYDMDSFKELFKDPKKALAENKAYWIKLGIRATTIVGVAVAGWACSFAEDRDKPVNVQPTTKPQFGLITESGGNALLASQLDIVKRQSGNSACKPMIIGADSGKPNLGETTGLCDLDGKTQIVMRKGKNGKTEVINKPLVARSNGEVGYQKTNGEWVVVIKTSENGNTWVFSNGETMPIEDQTPMWEQILGKLLEPGGSAVAAEVTPLPTEAPTSTPTLAPTPSKTPTFAPSLTPIPATIGATVVKPTPIQATATPKPTNANGIEGYPNGTIAVYDVDGAKFIVSSSPLPSKYNPPAVDRGGWVVSDCRKSNGNWLNCPNLEAPGVQYKTYSEAETVLRSKFNVRQIAYAYKWREDYGLSVSGRVYLVDGDIK